MSIEQEPCETCRSRPVGGHAPFPLQVWDLQEMRWALAHRDIKAVFKILQRFGVPQRRIAAITHQSQGEVSEIVSGRRAVMSYDLLVRIADGLDIPRGWMGLAHDSPLSAELESTQHDGWDHGQPLEPDKRNN